MGVRSIDGLPHRHENDGHNDIDLPATGGKNISQARKLVQKTLYVSTNCQGVRCFSPFVGIRLLLTFPPVERHGPRSSFKREGRGGTNPRTSHSCVCCSSPFPGNAKLRPVARCLGYRVIPYQF